MTDAEWRHWTDKLEAAKLPPDDLFGCQIMVVVVRYALNVGQRKLNRELLERLVRHAEQGKPFRSFKT